MPLVIICGTPVSGKTTRARQIKEFFEKKHGKKVDIVSEDETIVKHGYDKNSFYLDSQKEKRVRGYLKSEVIKLIGKDGVVVLDGSNYIKGFRYELHCAAKACKSTQCTIFTIRNHEEAWKANKQRKDAGKTVHFDDVQYTEEVFTALTKFRFEEPNPSNRWDSPLYTVQPSDRLPFEEIYKALFERKPPKPNQSTQNPPLTSSNFLYDLDNITRSVTQRITEARQMNVTSGVTFTEYPDCSLDAHFVNTVTPAKLLSLRRQFITFAKQNYTNETANKLGRYFIQYLNKSLVD